MHHIYRITNIINQKVYIGQTVNPTIRWTHHKSDAKSNKSKKQIVHHAIAKYGSDNFIFEVIVSCLSDCSQHEVDEIEDYFIQIYESRDKNKGYNIKPGGSSRVGYLHSEESKRKMSEAKKGKKVSHLIGYKHSDDIKNKMSTNHSNVDRRTGLKHSEDARKKMSDSAKGRTWKLIDGKRVFFKKE